MSKSRSVAITGIGIVSPLGIGHKAHWQGLDTGNTAVRMLQFQRHEYFPFKYGCTIEDFDIKNYFTAKITKHLNRSNQFALLAASLAIQDANLSPNIPPNRKGLFFLTGMGFVDENDLEEAIDYCSMEGNFSYHLMGEKGIKLINPLLPVKSLPNTGLGAISMHFNFQGPNLVASPFESETPALLGEATRSIIDGKADICLIGGSDAPFYVSIIGYLSAIGKLGGASVTENEIFDNVKLGEGSVFIVLEDAERALAEDKHIYGFINEYIGTTVGGNEWDYQELSRAYEFSINKMIKYNHPDLAIISDNGIGVVTDVEKNFWSYLNTGREKVIDTVSFKNNTGYFTASSLLFDICHACLISKNNRLPGRIDDSTKKYDSILVCGISFSQGVSTITVNCTK